MGKAKLTHFIFSWNLAKSGTNSELDKLLPNYQKVGNSASKIHDKLIYFYECCSFYHKYKFNLELHEELQTTAEITNIRNVFDGGT
jgi:hypothetical protein